MIPHPFHDFANYSHSILIILKIVSSPSIYSCTHIHTYSDEALLQTVQKPENKN